MPAPPLTHHEIIELSAPFARQGRHVDLAASQRAERQLVFKPLDHEAGAPGEPPLREVLRLDSFGTGTFRLTRTLSRPDGLQATLQAQGPQPAELLERINAVPPAHHFRNSPGHVLARSYGFDAVAAPGEAATDRLVLTQGVAMLDGLRVTFNLSPVKGVSADVVLTPVGGGSLALPEDLLAVLGWDWARLVPDSQGWTSKLRLRGKPARRTRSAEAALEKAAAHLVQVLAEPPARFHERRFWARWGVVFRRAIPSLTAIGLIVGAFSLPRMSIEQRPGLWMALHYAPIGLLALAFMLQELPRFEIPPLPRRSRAPGWRVAASKA